MEARTHSPVVGVAWMIVTGALFVGVNVVVKHLGSEVPPAEAAFLRYAIGLIFLVPALKPILQAQLTRRTATLFGVRGAFHTVGVMLWFYAMARIPIAEVTALNYLNPVGVTIGAAIFLGEALAIRRIMAVVAALVGAMIILRPGFRELSLGHFAMLGTAACFAVSYLIAKIMADEASPAVVVGMLGLTVLVGLAPFAYAVWVPPTWTQLGWLALVAAFATAGHYTMTLAFAAAPVTVTQPVTFLQLVWAVLIGATMFDEPADSWVMLGGFVIISAVTFITWREAMAKRRKITPVAIETKI